MDLPTPLTPTMEMIYGRGLTLDKGFDFEGEVMAVMVWRMSSEVVGVRILRREDSIAVRMVDSTPEKSC